MERTFVSTEAINNDKSSDNSLEADTPVGKMRESCVLIG